MAVQELLLQLAEFQKRLDQIQQEASRERFEKEALRKSNQRLQQQVDSLLKVASARAPPTATDEFLDVSRSFRAEPATADSARVLEWRDDAGDAAAGGDGDGGAMGGGSAMGGGGDEGAMMALAPVTILRKDSAPVAVVSPAHSAIPGLTAAKMAWPGIATAASPMAAVRTLVRPPAMPDPSDGEVATAIPLWSSASHSA